MQQVGDGANFAGDVSDEGLIFGDGALAGFVELAGLRSDERNIHGDGGEHLSGGVMQVAGEAAAFFVADAEELGGKIAEAVVGVVEFDGAGEDAVFEVGLSGLQFFFDAFVFGDVASGARDKFDGAVAIKDGRENIFVPAADAGGAGVLGLIGEMSRVSMTVRICF